MSSTALSPTPFPGIHEILAGQAVARPHATFLRDHHGALTFEETRQQVGLLAAGLARQGVTPGDRIALMLPNGIDFVLLWMACARMRVLCVFVNPAYVGDMLDYVLDDAAPKGLICDGTVAANVRSASGDVLGRLKWACMLHPGN